MANKQNRNYNLQPWSTFLWGMANILNQTSQPRSSSSNFKIDETLSTNAFFFFSLSLLSSFFIISPSSDNSKGKNICGIELAHLSKTTSISAQSPRRIHCNWCFGRKKKMVAMDIITLVIRNNLFTFRYSPADGKGPRTLEEECTFSAHGEEAWCRWFPFAKKYQWYPLY